MTGMSHSAFEFTCVGCGAPSTAWAEDLRSDHAVECSSCGAHNDSSGVIPDAVRRAIEQTLDTRWPGAYLGVDTEDWATDTHIFVIRADDRQYRLIVGDRVRQSGNVLRAIDPIRTKEGIWIQLLKDSGCVVFTMRAGEYVFDPRPERPVGGAGSEREMTPFDTMIRCSGAARPMTPGREEMGSPNC